MNMLNPVIFSYQNTIMLIIRLLTTQYAYSMMTKISHFQRKASRVKYLILLLLVNIWLLLSTLLSFSFTSLLLNTYFNVKSEPIINTLQGVIDNKQYSVASPKEWFNMAIIPRIPANKQVDFARRLHEHSPHSAQVFNDVIKGKTIMMSNTFITGVYP